MPKQSTDGRERRIADDTQRVFMGRAVERFFGSDGLDALVEHQHDKTRAAWARRAQEIGRSDPAYLKCLFSTDAHEYEIVRDEPRCLEVKVHRCVHADVVDPAAMSTDRVVFGLQVKVQDLDTDEEITYQIVGVDEADIAQQRISVSSPVARALIGKSVGDVVQVQIPRGLRELEILEISNP